MKTVFDRFHASEIGILLLSQSYLQSGNCLHEAQEMTTRRDRGRMQIFPIMLPGEEKLDLPPFISDI